MSTSMSTPEWVCNKCTAINAHSSHFCWNCKYEKPSQSGESSHLAEQMNLDSIPDLLATNTPTIEGRRIAVYCGIVSAEAILGVNILKDMLGSVRDIVGGRSATYEKELQHARDIAFSELQRRAKEKKANAIVGVQISYQVLGQQNGMLMVAVSGTAVVAE